MRSCREGVAVAYPQSKFVLLIIKERVYLLAVSQLRILLPLKMTQ